MKTENIREVTKKIKFKGLTKKSWFFAGIISSGLFPTLKFWAIFLFLFLIIVLYIAEFFDDDIAEIILAKMQLGAKNEYYS